MSSILENIRQFKLAPYLIIFYTVGVAGLIIPQTRELFKILVPYNLFLNLFILIIYHGKMGKGFIWKILFIISAGILVEVIGVNTGVIFGSYEYGPTLGIKIFHTPIVIGANWFMLVYGSLTITSRFIDVRYFRIVIASVLMVIYDFALEPAAIALEMWDWAGPVPLQNYIAWFIVSFLLIWFADKTELVNKQNKIAAPLFYIQLGFFVVLNIWLFIR